MYTSTARGIGCSLRRVFVSPTSMPATWLRKFSIAKDGKAHHKFIPKSEIKKSNTQLQIEESHRLNPDYVPTEEPEAAKTPIQQKLHSGHHVHPRQPSFMSGRREQAHHYRFDDRSSRRDEHGHKIRSEAPPNHEVYDEQGRPL